MINTLQKIGGVCRPFSSKQERKKEKRNKGGTLMDSFTLLTQPFLSEADAQQNIKALSSNIISKAETIPSSGRSEWLIILAIEWWLNKMEQQRD